MLINKVEPSYYRFTLPFTQTTLGGVYGTNACVFVSLEFMLSTLTIINEFNYLKNNCSDKNLPEVFLRDIAAPIAKETCIKAFNIYKQFCTNNHQLPFINNAPLNTYCNSPRYKNEYRLEFKGYLIKDSTLAELLLDNGAQSQPQRPRGYLVGCNNHMLSVIDIGDDALLLFNSLPAINTSNLFTKVKGHLFGSAYLVLFKSENALQKLEHYIKKHLLKDNVDEAHIFKVSDL